MSGKEKRKKKRKATALESQVARWETHISDKDSMLKDLPNTLSDLKPAQTSVEPTKHRKRVTPSVEDDATTQECIAIANRHSLQSMNQNTVILPSRVPPPEPVNRYRQETRIRFHSNIRPLSELVMQLGENQPTGPVIMPVNPIPTGKELTLTTTRSSGFARMERIFEESQQHWHQRAAKKMENGVTAHAKEQVSRYHIAKVLWCHTPLRPFDACMMSTKGWCQAQQEDSLRHPLAPQQACMAYYSPQQYSAVLSGFTENSPHQELCEFCYRYFVTLEVEKAKANSHRTEQEIPSRYYNVGTPGEYSIEGMHQPVEKKSTQHIDGILGHMRCYNTSDFVPVVGLLNGQGEVEKVWHVDEYKRQCESKRLQPDPQRHIYGWQEVKPIYDLNDQAFFQVHQINPYLRTVCQPVNQSTVSHVLEDYFEKCTHSAQQRYSHIFWDLMKCVNDPDYLSRPNLCQQEKELDRWSFWCLHAPGTQNLAAETHKIYLCLLIKLNTCWRLSEEKHQGIVVTSTIKQKLKFFMNLHRPLSDWLEANRCFTDQELTGQLVYDPQLDMNVTVLFANYPRDVSHFRVNDYAQVKYNKLTYERASPLEICRAHYARESVRTANYRLPHSFTSVLTELGQHNSALAQLSLLRRRFEENCLAIERHVTLDEWYISDAYNSSRKSKETSAASPPPPPPRSTLDIDQIVEQARHSFAQQQAWVREKNAVRLLVLQWRELVLCDFNHTVEQLRAMPEFKRAEIIDRCDNFKQIIPKSEDNLPRITPQTLNSQPWEHHLVFLACLLRVYVLEVLHESELSQEKVLRFNLALLRNSHLRLFRKLAEHPQRIVSDTECLLKRTATQHCLLDWYYPYPTREVHPGQLPDYINSLAKVNFISDGGLDDYVWIKMKFKLPDRCCDGREFPDMLQTHCLQDESFYAYTCLELELSLKGLYPHCSVRPFFAETVVLDELFDNFTDPEAKQIILQMISELKTMIPDAISESLCYMLEYAGALRDVLNEAYKDWFSWRVIANMDMARKCFQEFKNFTEVEKIVYERIRLNSNKTIYRHVESNFVSWICNHLKRQIEIRHKRGKTPFSEIVIRPENLPTMQDKTKINAYIFLLTPTQQIDAMDLLEIGLSEETINMLYELVQIFRKQHGYTQEQAEKLTLQSVSTCLEGFVTNPRQYNLLRFFFNALNRYQNVRAMRIENSLILEQQKNALCQRYQCDNLADLPRCAYHGMFSVCCSHVKNTFPGNFDAFASGSEGVFFSPNNNFFSCAKPEQRASKRKANVNTTSRKAALKRELELSRPICHETPILFVNALAEVIEMDVCKVPGAKKNKKNKKIKQIARPSAPFWITPCCGILFSYKYRNWYPGGYACGLCKRTDELANSFKALFCTICKLATTKYTLVKTFDDVYTNTFTRVLICAECLHNWPQSSALMFPLSCILEGVCDPEAVVRLLK